MKKLFFGLPKDFSMPIIVVQHISPLSKSEWIDILNQKCLLDLKEADEKETVRSGTIYIAPPNYHLLIEREKTFSLSTGERVSYARPSIDVLFETACEAYRERLIGVILTGSNHDGTAGLKCVKKIGGLCIVQDPDDAFSSYMPANAIKEVGPHHVLKLEDIIDLLVVLDKKNNQ